MTRTSGYNRVIMTLIFVILCAHTYCSHDSQNSILTALTEHQQHSIEGFTQIDNTLANSILKRAESQRDKNIAIQDARPTATPRVITKTKTRTRYIKQKPKPFRLFGPN